MINIFGYNYLQHGNNGGGPNMYNQYPPHHYQHHQHHQHHKHTSSLSSNHLNEINETTSDNMKTPRLNRKQDSKNNLNNSAQCSLCLTNSNYNIGNSVNNNIDTMNKNENNCDNKRLNTLKQKFKYFWQCTKPCGILSIVFALLLLSSSICGFIFLQVDSICEKAQTCSNATLKVCSVSLLVLSIVTLFFGLIITIYSKRDRNANIIVASTKNLDNLDFQLKQQQQQQQQQQHHHNHHHHNHHQLSMSQNNLNTIHKVISLSTKNIPQMLNRSTSNLATESSNVNQPLLKSASIAALNVNNII